MKEYFDYKDTFSPADTYFVLQKKFCLSDSCPALVEKNHKDWIMVSHLMSVCILSICILFPDDNLSKYQWIFTKLGMCIDVVEIVFGIAFGQILAIF